MNEDLDQFLPDRNHLRHFPDDSYLGPRGEQSRRRRSRRSIPQKPIRLRVFAYGVALGFLAFVLIALTSCAPSRPTSSGQGRASVQPGSRPCNLSGKIVGPCVITPDMMTPERTEAEDKAIRQTQFELMEQQHKGLSQAMRDFRFDSLTKSTKEQPK